MPAIVHCPRCERPLRVADQLLGNTVQCPECGATFDTAAGAAAAPPGGPDRADEDEDEEEDRPWERPPRRPIRRDCDPHRGPLIMTLGIASIVLGATWILSPVGLALGITAWVLGQRDLDKIGRYVMDPNGQGQTQAGRICGIVGTVLSGLWSTCCLGYVVIVALAIHGHL